MGSPASPTPAQIAALEKVSKLATLGKPQTLQVREQQVVVKMQLPRQAVSFIKLSY
jgi:xylan 1,4-beta-xylosidase